ncbi:MAG: hypothetical protein H0U74_16515 [Bradymonadaceae bacterium]|nr:hypothetical protein [Lujinxingiaceae bacterium]
MSDQDYSRSAKHLQANETLSDAPTLQRPAVSEHDDSDTQRMPALDIRAMIDDEPTLNGEPDDHWGGEEHGLKTKSEAIAEDPTEVINRTSVLAHARAEFDARHTGKPTEILSAINATRPELIVNDAHTKVLNTNSLNAQLSDSRTHEVSRKALQAQTLRVAGLDLGADGWLEFVVEVDHQSCLIVPIEVARSGLLKPGMRLAVRMRVQEEE